MNPDTLGTQPIDSLGAASPQDDDLDLGELLRVAIARVKLITFVTLLFGGLAVAYVLWSSTLYSEGEGPAPCARCHLPKWPVA